MSAGDLVLVVAAVLCAIGFAALVVVLLRVLDTLRDVRREVDQLRMETTPLIRELLATTDEARATVDEARADLERFDRVLGSAEAIGDAVGGRVARTTFSAPMIKATELRPGHLADDRPASRRRPTHVDRAGGGALHRARRHTTLGEPDTMEETSMMKRVTWFAGGVVAGIASAGYAKKKVKETASQVAPAQLARSAASSVRSKTSDVVDAIREGRQVMKHTEDELRARREGRLTSLDEHVAPGDQVFVDGVPGRERPRHRDAPQRAHDPVVTTPLVAALRTRLRPDQVRDGAGEVNLYRHDASNLSGHPAVVCFAETVDDVRAIVQVANDLGVPFVPRGSGTGLAGGAVPPTGSIVISTSKMNRIVSVDALNRTAWVEPGVLNLDLSKQIAHLGVHFAPDPSSQQTCSIGGNVANNSGGPHCLADGVTSAHILALEVVLPDGSVTVFGGEDTRTGGLRPARRVRRQRGDVRRRHQDVRQADAEPARRGHDAARLRRCRRRRAAGERHHRRRDRARGGRDDGPAVPAGGRGVHPRRSAGRPGGGTADRGGRASRIGGVADRADP